VARLGLLAMVITMAWQARAGKAAMAGEAVMAGNVAMAGDAAMAMGEGGQWRGQEMAMAGEASVL
jgi:hypothetical protein